MLSLYMVSFFGHRHIENIRSVESGLEQIIDRLLNENEYIEFLVGREGEFDQLVASSILRIKKKRDKVNCFISWVMPYIKADYLNNKESYENYYDNIELCEESERAHPKAEIQIRNKSIVYRSNLCVFYVKHQHGGAFQTLKYSVKKGANIINIADYDFL